MNWHDYISSDPEICIGKPIVIGTRLSVVFILEELAEGSTLAELLAEYPRLTPEAIQAVFAFVAEVLGEEAMYAMPAKLAL